MGVRSDFIYEISAQEAQERGISKMRDGAVGILGTGGTYVLQEVSLWLSVACAVVTLTHFALVFKDRYSKKDK
mgnify:CR=1 FL=1